jgi:hypothetical protein
MPMIAGYGGGWWIYGEKSGVKRMPGDYKAALNAFLPQNGATRRLVSRRKSGTVPPRIIAYAKLRPGKQNAH